MLNWHVIKKKKEDWRKMCVGNLNAIAVTLISMAEMCIKAYFILTGLCMISNKEIYIYNDSKTAFIPHKCMTG